MESDNKRDGGKGRQSDSEEGIVKEKVAEEEAAEKGFEEKEEEKGGFDVEKLKAEVEQERKRAEEYLNRLKYLQADFENAQKTAMRQREEYIQFANERLLVNFLEVVDNLERAVEAGRNTKNEEALIDGVEITLKSLKELLSGEGITQIEALDKPFDPNLHESVERIETSDHPENTVVEELRKGYLMKEKVIRPSVVKVAKSPAKKEEPSK